MRLRPEQLDRHLQQTLLPLYVVSGDEPLLVQEAVDSIRQAARHQGVNERIVHYAGSGFDWHDLLQAARGMSLFAERRLIELNMPSAKPGDAGSRVLQAYCQEMANGENILLIIAGKLDKQSQNSKWFKALDQIGAVIQLWPPDSAQLPGWLDHRMRARGLQPTREALMLLVDRVEGNLLAAAQEIEKMLLLHDGGRIDADDVARYVGDSARFDIFAAVDEILAGHVGRVVKMINGLRAEGVEPPLLLWSLVRECRALAMMAGEIAAGEQAGTVLARYRVWSKRQPCVKQALSRHNAADWARMLRHAARIDRQIKGMAPGNVWDELLQLGQNMAGSTGKQVA